MTFYHEPYGTLGYPRRESAEAEAEISRLELRIEILEAKNRILKEENKACLEIARIERIKAQLRSAVQDATSEWEGG
jgi:hypothetical protein